MFTERAAAISASVLRRMNQGKPPISTRISLPASNFEISTSSELEARVSPAGFIWSTRGQAAMTAPPKAKAPVAMKMKLRRSLSGEDNSFMGHHPVFHGRLIWPRRACSVACRSKAPQRVACNRGTRDSAAEPGREGGEHVLAPSEYNPSVRFWLRTSIEGEGRSAQ